MAIQTMEPNSANPNTTWDTIEVAAAKLGIGAGALRARCRRAAAKGRAVVAFPWFVAIGSGGVIAMRLGRHWRVSVPSAEAVRREAASLERAIAKASPFGDPLPLEESDALRPGRSDAR